MFKIQGICLKLNFREDKIRNDALIPICKSCVQVYYSNNQEKDFHKTKDWNDKNPGKSKMHQKKYNEKNHANRNTYLENR